MDDRSGESGRVATQTFSAPQVVSAAAMSASLPMSRSLRGQDCLWRRLFWRAVIVPRRLSSAPIHAPIIGRTLVTRLVWRPVPVQRILPASRARTSPPSMSRRRFDAAARETASSFVATARSLSSAAACAAVSPETASLVKVRLGCRSVFLPGIADDRRLFRRAFAACCDSQGCRFR